MTCRTVISKVKVTGGLDNTVIQNALTFTPGLLEWGGSLIHNTDVTGNYAINFGTSSSSIREFNVKASNNLNFEYNNGSNLASIKFDSSGIFLTDNTITPKGISGASDYSINYTPFSFVQKIYVDTHLVGKNLSNILLNPNNSQNGFAITWDNTAQVYTLSPPGSVSAGSDTQVIYNSSGALVGNNSFTYSSNTLTVPHINIGGSTVTGQRIFQVVSNEANTGLTINTKGSSNLTLGIITGKIALGQTSSTNTIQSLLANGSNAQIDIALEPKGSDGIVYIGSSSEVGGYRYIQARGNSANINLYLGSKGTGSVILENNAPVLIGLPTESSTIRTIKAGSSVTSDLSIGGNGVGSKILIGDGIENSSDRYIYSNSGSTNANLHIYGKGTGLVSVNGVVNYKKIPIGDWNMNSFNDTTVTHGLPDFRKIINVHVVIRDDTNSTYTPLNRAADSGGGTLEGGVTSWSSSLIFLERRNSGFYDNTTHQNTGFNRGWVYISYEV